MGGINNTREDQSQLGRLAMTVDAYRSLELLGKHPRIDPARIVLMGFSRGGQATLYASVKRFQRMPGPANLEFAACIAFYPDCSPTYKDDAEVAYRPSIFPARPPTGFPLLPVVPTSNG